MLNRWWMTALLVLSPPSVIPLAGQASRIEGRVEDEITGRPVPGARLFIVGTSLKTRTDSNGGYRLERVSPGRVSLRVEAERYTSLVQDLEVEPASTVIFPLTLSPLAVVLDRLLARASPGDRSSATSTGVVSGDRFTGSASTRPGDAVTARVPGARVLFSGGAVGMATQILLRGFKSMNLPGDPLYYVDGIPTAPPTAPSARNRGGEPSILDLIDPSTIARIEVLSGAAASATFGLGSNNGVILIYTKR